MCNSYFMNNCINKNMSVEEWNKKIKEVCSRNNSHIKSLSENEL